jgi:hypothetical protein
MTTARNLRRLTRRYQRPRTVSLETASAIAAMVQNIQLAAFLSRRGACKWRALVGKALLDALNIPAEIVIGAAAYRPSPHQVLGICNEAFVADGVDHLHFFLISGNDEVIDFSTADWPSDYPHVRFESPPPPFVWCDHRVVSGEPPPALGELWYAPGRVTDALRACGDCGIADDLAKVRELVLTAYAQRIVKLGNTL